MCVDKWLAIKRHYTKSLGISSTDNWRRSLAASGRRCEAPPARKTDQTVNSKLVSWQGETTPHFYEAGQFRPSELHRQAYKELCVAQTEHLLNLKCLKLAYFHPPLKSWSVEDVVHSLEERTVKSLADK